MFYGENLINQSRKLSNDAFWPTPHLINDSRKLYSSFRTFVRYFHRISALKVREGFWSYKRDQDIEVCSRLGWVTNQHLITQLIAGQNIWKEVKKSI